MTEQEVKVAYIRGMKKAFSKHADIDTSHLQSGLIGSLLGAGAGAGVGALTASPEERRKKALRGAALGGLGGAGLGALTPEILGYLRLKGLPNLQGGSGTIGNYIKTRTEGSPYDKTGPKSLQLIKALSQAGKR